MATAFGNQLADRTKLIMSQSWGQNLGLMEQKLAKKARFTCVVGAFDTSCHLTIGSSDHPTMCGIVSFALRLLERVV